MTATMLDRVISLLNQAPNTGNDPRALAIALLEAMREPGTGMAEAGAEVIPSDSNANHVEVANDVWRAMVGEAIARDFAIGNERSGVNETRGNGTGTSYDEEEVLL